MKAFFSILVILIITISSLHKSIVFAYYAYDKEYIIENLCQNADEPEMGCEGKCYLMNKANDEKATSIIVDLLKSIKEFNAQISNGLILEIHYRILKQNIVSLSDELELGHESILNKPPILRC